MDTLYCVETKYGYSISNFVDDTKLGGVKSAIKHWRIKYWRIHCQTLENSFDNQTGEFIGDAGENMEE